MEKKSKNNYNHNLTNLLGNEVIPYDKEVLYKSVGDFAEKKLRDKMDDEFIKNVIFIIEDPLAEYGENTIPHKDILKLFLPHIKKLLGVTPKKPLMKMLGLNLIGTDIHRLINQQFEIYNGNIDRQGRLAYVLDSDNNPKKGYIETQKRPLTKLLTTKEIPSLHKTIVANLMLLLIMEEELKAK
ncbi:MAG: hypothetical protein WC010_01745 [Candidatus Absconditabacterales bacterium]